MATIDSIATSEVWAAIPEWEALYEVSTLGRVRRSCPGRGTFAGKILQTVRYGKGYRAVTLHIRPRRYKQYVHILVLAAFVGPRPAGFDINHKNGNKADNRLENLEYVTKSENSRHAWRSGLNWHKGERSHYSKLREDQVKEIRAKYATGRYSYGALAALFGVTHGAIGLIVTRQHWKHVH